MKNSKFWIKRLASTFTAASFLLCAPCTSLATGEIAQKIYGDNVLFFEDFQDAQIGSAIVSETSCLPKWTLKLGSDPDKDTTFTVEADSGDADNKLGKIYKESPNSTSCEMLMQHTFANVVDGGIVDLEMRIKRMDSPIKEWDVTLYDSSNNLMQFRISLQNSVLIEQKVSGSVLYPETLFFNENTGVRRTSKTGYAFDHWLNIKLRLDLDNNQFDFYQNGFLVADDYPMIGTFNGKLSMMRLGTARNMSSNSNGTMYIDDITLTRISAKMTDEERIAKTKEVLASLFINPLEEDIELPVKGWAGTQIAWKSDNEEIITSAGVISRLYMQEQTTKLTATLTSGQQTDTAEYTVTVAAITEIVAPTAELMGKAVDAFRFSVISDNSIYGVKDKLNLIEEYNEGRAALFGGVDVEWTLPDGGIILADGTLNKTNKTQKAELTANFAAKDDESITGSKTFTIEILPKGESYVYETFDTPESTPGQTLDGWNGWTMKYPSPTSTDNIVDSFYTIENETSSNKIFQIYRSNVQTNSGYFSVTKNFETPLDGGSVSIKFRVKVNANAKRLFVHLNDTNNVQEEIVVDFGNNRINQGQSGLWEDKYFGFTAKADEWHMAEVIANYDRGVFAFYLDGNLIGENLKLKDNSGKLASIGFSNTRHAANKAGALFHIDDLFVTRATDKITDNDAVSEVVNELKNSLDGEIITEDMELSVYGNYKSAVIWKSSDEEVIKIINGRGIITQPDGEDREVILTVTAVRGGIKAMQEITVKVPAFEGSVTPTQEMLHKAADGYTFDEVTDEKSAMITRDIILPSEYNKGYAKKIGGVNITWKSSMPHVVSDDGKVTRQKYDTFLTLTAEFSAKANSALTALREYKIAVPAEGELILNDDFDDASFEEDMYKQIGEGEFSKNVYGDWILVGIDPGNPMYTDTQVVYFPDNPYQKVFNYTRSRNRKDNLQPTPNTTFTYKELGRELGTGTLYISLKFYLGNKNSLVSVMPMNTNQKFSSSATSVNTTSGGGITLPTEKKLSLNKWYTLTIVMHLSGDVKVGHTYDVFVDGQKLNTNQIALANGYPIYALAISSVRTSDGPNSNWYIDDVTVRHVDYDVTDDVMAATEALELPFSGMLTGDIELPAEGENGTRIIWTSSDKKVLSDGGKVFPDKNARSVTLSATVIKENVMQTKNFNLIVAPQNAQPYEVKSLNITGNSLVGATVRNNSFSGNAVLLTKIYSRGKLMDIRISSLSTQTGTEESITFTKPIDFEEYLKYDIETYVYDMDTNTIISSIHS